MSEYWKSTPKYWCKHCKTYVRDTKFERTQHESTGKHQGNLKRFLRELHRDHERDERENQKAKNEVDRLNKIVSGSTSNGGIVPSNAARTPAISHPAVTQNASVAERKKQLAQLADMGIAIPDEFRGEMAMAGDWKTMSERPLSTTPEDGSLSDTKLNIGVRKRKHEGEEEEEEAAEQTAVKRGWGSTTRTYPGEEVDDDLEALLSGTRQPKVKRDVKVSAVDPSPVKPETVPEAERRASSMIKQEESEDPNAETNSSIIGAASGADTETQIIFKKRKKPLKDK